MYECDGRTMLYNQSKILSMYQQRIHEANPVLVGNTQYYPLESKMVLSDVAAMPKVPIVTNKGRIERLHHRTCTVAGLVPMAPLTSINHVASGAQARWSTDQAVRFKEVVSSLSCFLVVLPTNAWKSRIPGASTDATDPQQSHFSFRRTTICRAFSIWHCKTGPGKYFGMALPWP